MTTTLMHNGCTVLIVGDDDGTYGWSAYWMDGTGGGASGLAATHDLAERDAREAITTRTWSSAYIADLDPRECRGCGDIVPLHDSSDYCSTCTYEGTPA